MERLFVLKTLSRTQRATKVKKFVGFSLKPLRCRDPALPPLYGHAYSRPFFHAYFSCIYAHAYFSCIYAHDTPPRVQHFSAFHSTCTAGTCMPKPAIALLCCTFTNWNMSTLIEITRCSMTLEQQEITKTMTWMSCSLGRGTVPVCQRYNGLHAPHCQGRP